MTKQEAKIELYNQLISLKESEITSVEIDIMFALSQDEEVQSILNVR